MVSVSLSLATFSLCSAAILANGHPQDEQLFTEYSLAGTTTVHVPGDGKATTTSHDPTTTAAPSATGLDIPSSCVNLAVEAGAILWSNYRKTGVSHEEGTKLVRDGINLYVKQPAIVDLMNKGYAFYKDNFVSFDALKNTTIPEDFAENIIAEIAQANEKFLDSPGFAEVDKYLKSNIDKFDIGALVTDVSNLINIDPTFTKKVIEDVRSQVSENPANAKAAKELFSLAVKYAQRYGINTDVIQSGVDKIIPFLM